MLRRCIVAHTPHSPQSCHRGIVDDHALVFLDKLRDHIFGSDPSTLEVNVDHRIPFFFGKLPGISVGSDPGIAEQNVDPAKLLDASCNRLLDVLLIPDVACVDNDPASQLFHLILQGFQILIRGTVVRRILDLLSQIKRDDICSLPGKSQSNRSSLSFSCSCDKYRFSFKFLCHFSLLLS